MIVNMHKLPDCAYAEPDPSVLRIVAGTQQQGALPNRWTSLRSWKGCLALAEDQLISVSFLAAAGASYWQLQVPQT